MRKAKRYQKENGDEPFTIWINSLDKAIKPKVQIKINKLEEGNYSDCSILKGTGGVREARIRMHVV
jgi:putative component of toxin-antitoxin plasmid stabilization module